MLLVVLLAVALTRSSTFSYGYGTRREGTEYETGTTTTAGRSKLEEQNKLTQVLALHGLIDGQIPDETTTSTGWGWAGSNNLYKVKSNGMKIRGTVFTRSGRNSSSFS